MNTTSLPMASSSLKTPIDQYKRPIETSTLPQHHTRWFKSAYSDRTGMNSSTTSQGRISKTPLLRGPKRKGLFHRQNEQKRRQGLAEMIELQRRTFSQVESSKGNNRTRYNDK
ncbi:hypothetical protein BDF19DRAFT_58981 [Syncephalis fuscata]|nr:hypothetical protein BDF19DRAFT_58981 [Syncephalis fuscata]